MYWYPNGWIPDITLVAVVNGDGQEFFVGNYKNGDGPITGEIGFGGRLSINALPVSGPSAAASSAAFVRSNFVGFVVVGEESIAGPGNQTNGATWSSLTGGVGSWQEHAGPPDAKSLVDIVPSNEEYLVAGYLSSDNSPAIWLYDATGWSGEVTLSGGTPNGSLTLIDDDTAIDASHIWTSLSNGHPVIHSLPSGYTFRSATRLQDGYVALGTSVQGPQNDVIMVSADATNWNAAADNPDYDKYPMQSIVSSFEGVVGLGRAVFQGPNSIAAFQLASP
jgi:hypothetical protein